MIDDADGMPPPRAITEQMREITIKGHLVPWFEGQPVYLVVGGPDWYVPIFASEQQLREMMAEADVPYTSIKQIDSQHEFLDSFPEFIDGHRLRFMINPWWTPEGRLRFVQLVR